ncbi:MAG: hypothetical protein U0271_40585 [Polyangiaceae bacterium]
MRGHGNTKSNNAPSKAPRRDVLALHVMRELFRAQRGGRRTTIDAVAKKLGVRKTDVRSVVTALDAQGFVDAARLRLTMLGFAFAATAPAPDALREPAREHQAQREHSRVALAHAA